MRRIAYAVIMLMGVLTIAGCARVDELFNGKTEKITFVASFADDTRTSYQGEGKVDWEEGDSILYYTKKGGSIEEYEVVRSGHSTNVVADVTSGTSYIIAAYGGTGITDNTVTSFTLNGAVKAEQTGKFEDAHVSVAKGFDIEDGASLKFHNMTSLIKFTLERIDVSYITFTANGGEKIHGNGIINVAFNDDVPSASFGDEGGSTIKVNTKGAGTFYISTLPIEMTQGFTIRYFNDSDIIVGETIYATNFTIASNELLNMGAFDATMVNYSEPVDLGLSVKWAQCNIGAYIPNEYGDYYAWGEIEPYYETGYSQSDTPMWKFDKSAGYEWQSYRWWGGVENGNNSFTKYNHSPFGIVDNTSTLTLEDDVASREMGSYWRIPSDSEWNELLDKNNCEWTSYVQNGVSGILVKSKKNGNSIFLPKSGCRNGIHISSQGKLGYYWSSTLSNASFSYAAYACFFGSADSRALNGYDRFRGYCVRPVYDEVLKPYIKMNMSSLTLPVDSSAVLSVAYYPSDWTDKDVVWNSSDKTVAIVDDSGSVTALKAGTVTITATPASGGNTQSCSVKVVNYPLPAVDMGLSVKWGQYNLGSFSPEDYGDYYAWGELEPYYAAGYAQCDSPIWKSGKSAGYDWPSYRFGTFSSLTKYNNSSDYGVVDKKKVLEMEDDAANVNLGGKWRIPTDAEWTELRDHNNCSWTWTTQDGIMGYSVNSKITGNSIFLPAAGERNGTDIKDVGKSGRYCSSSLNSSNAHYVCGIYITFTNGANGSQGYYERFYETIRRTRGFSIRPVSE